MLSFPPVQVLSKVYAILSDNDKRALYDEDGTIDDEEDTLFKQVIQYVSLNLNTLQSFI